MFHTLHYQTAGISDLNLDLFNEFLVHTEAFVFVSSGRKKSRVSLHNVALQLLELVDFRQVIILLADDSLELVFFISPFVV